MFTNPDTILAEQMLLFTATSQHEICMSGRIQVCFEVRHRIQVFNIAIPGLFLELYWSAFVCCYSFLSCHMQSAPRDFQLRACWALCLATCLARDTPDPLKRNSIVQYRGFWIHSTWTISVTNLLISQVEKSSLTDSSLQLLADQFSSFYFIPYARSSPPTFGIPPSHSECASDDNLLNLEASCDQTF